MEIGTLHSHHSKVMALFVAKLFDSQRPREFDTPVGDDSPVRRVKGRGKEPFANKLARMLRKGPKEFHSRPGEEFRAHLGEILSSRKAGVEIVRWPQDQLDLLASISTFEGDTDPGKYLDSAIASLDNLMEQQKKAREHEQERLVLREAELRQNAREITNVLPSVKKNLDSLVADIKQIESVIEPQMKDLKKMEFLDNLIACVNITDRLHLSQGAPDKEYLRQLASVALMTQSLHGRSRDVIKQRTHILVKKAVDHFNYILEDEHVELSDPKRVYAFEMLSKFQHPDRDKTISLFFAIKIKKFHFHFSRAKSSLNAIDKPEWPLRWLLDLTVEGRKTLPSDHSDLVVKYLAHIVRSYFMEYRWSKITNPQEPEDSELFSLYLARYLHNVQQWIQTFGEKVAQELLVDFRDNIHVGEQHWAILDAWIQHDRAHIDKAIETTKNPLKPSAFNPALCNLVQTLLDIFDTSRSRLGCIKSIPGLFSYFIENCHDQVLDDVMYRLRLTMTSDMSAEDSELIKRSIESLVGFLEETKLASASVRRQFFDLAKLI